MRTNSLASETSTAPRASVLLVEDDALSRALLRRMLETRGFAVAAAIDGRDGIKQFREKPVDIVVTDMMMPVMGGDELIRTLLVERPGLRIVAISGVEHPCLGTALSIGARATLAKPFDGDRLAETLRRVLAA